MSDRSASLFPREHVPRLIPGDCLDVLRTLPDASVDAVVTDPPYGLGFMGKHWDASTPGLAVFAELLRVLKPGGHLLCFSSTRTYHRTACAIEDAGFEVRDMIAWVYGSGFPKGQDVSKAIDKAAPATPDAARWEGWSTALKPALEPIAVARAPFKGTVAANVLAHGTGAINVDACRVPGEPVPTFDHVGPPEQGTAYGKKPQRSKSTGATTDQGRWPANLVHDGSAEATAGMPVTGRGQHPKRHGVSNVYGRRKAKGDTAVRNTDSGSAARYFYCAKASSAERDARCGGRNMHPTVKPLALMRWLVRLVTPPGGVVLDPFAGSGTTGLAAEAEGCHSILIEREPEYCEIIRERCGLERDHAGE